MKKILLISFFCAIAFGSYAQEEEISFLPKKGNFLTSLLLGRGQYASIANAPFNNTNNVTNANPVTALSTADNNNSLVNMIGVEGRYFIKNDLAIKFTGGVIIVNTPGRDYIDGVGGIAPAINSVDADQRTNVSVALGVEHHFWPNANHLTPYAGLSIPFFYSKHSNYDPAVIGQNATDLYGTRHATLLGTGAQAYAGIDYYINNDIYFGVQINALGYNYSLSQEVSGEGFEVSEADRSYFNFLTQPVIKFGFKL